jgi:DNA-binding GntR family transcriptional regulator
MAATVAAGGGPKEFLRGKDRFYEVLLAGARSPGLGAVITGLAARGRVVRAISLTVAGRPEVAVSELREVIEAVEARDADAAAAACGRHRGNARKTGLARLAALENVPPSDRS